MSCKKGSNKKKHLPREVLNPEKVATQMTEQMNKLLQLTDKQYKKIYSWTWKSKKAFSRLCKIRMTIAHQWEKSRYAGRTSANGGGQPPMMGEGWFPGRMEVVRWWAEIPILRLTKEAAEPKKENKKRFWQKNSMRNGRPNKIPHVKKLLKEECTKIIILTRVRTLNKKISKTSHLICFYEQRLFFIIF